MPLDFIAGLPNCEQQRGLGRHSHADVLGLLRGKLMKRRNQELVLVVEGRHWHSGDLGKYLISSEELYQIVGAQTFGEGLLDEQSPDPTAGLEPGAQVLAIVVDWDVVIDYDLTLFLVLHIAVYAKVESVEAYLADLLIGEYPVHQIGVVLKFAQGLEEALAGVGTQVVVSRLDAIAPVPEAGGGIDIGYSAPAGVVEHEGVGVEFVGELEVVLDEFVDEAAVHDIVVVRHLIGDIGVVGDIAQVGVCDAAELLVAVGAGGGGTAFLQAQSHRLITNKLNKNKYQNERCGHPAASSRTAPSLEPANRLSPRVRHEADLGGSAPPGSPFQAGQDRAELPAGDEDGKGQVDILLERGARLLSTGAPRAVKISSLTRPFEEQNCSLDAAVLLPQIEQREQKLLCGCDHQQSQNSEIEERLAGATAGVEIGVTGQRESN